MRRRRTKTPGTLRTSTLSWTHIQATILELQHAKRGKVKEEQSAILKKKAAKDKIRYEEEVKRRGKRKIERKKDDKDGKKRKKDKEAPKRPMSAYFLWTQAERIFIMKKHGIEKAGTEYTKKAAEEWKSVSDAIKKDYVKKAAAAKAQYLQDLEAYKTKKAGHDPEYS